MHKHSAYKINQIGEVKQIRISFHKYIQQRQIREQLHPTPLTDVRPREWGYVPPSTHFPPLGKQTPLAFV